MIENLRCKFIDRLKDYFRKKDCENAFLFGSYAINTQTKHSDIDIVVIKKTQKKFFDSMNDFFDLQDLFEISADILVYTPEEWMEMKNTGFFKHTTLIEIKSSKD